ncbi:DUF4505 family protein [Leptospira perolatii]|uniref:DUF4505 family protein n=1 Tax=Leptospira perolatii TaxID=2023191 RepID=UPI0013FD5F16|nr:DUF4505 family protein [Leptospira perolatii]
MREYFYKIDRQGRIFHDGTRLIDPSFLDFFLKRLVKNHTGLHPEFHYVSPCGKEMNFVQAETYPIIFFKMENARLFYSPGLHVEFQPESMRLDKYGNLIHPGPRELWGGFHLVLLSDFTKNLEEGTPCWKFTWEKKEYFLPKDR